MVEIPFTDENALTSLALALGEEPRQVSARGKRLMLSTAAEVDRFNGLKVHIYAGEPPPPHFRVSHQGASADFRIDDCRVPFSKFLPSGSMTTEQRLKGMLKGAPKIEFFRMWKAPSAKDLQSSFEGMVPFAEFSFRRARAND